MNTIASMGLADFISVFSLLFLALGIFLTLRQFKLTNTLEFIKRYNEPDFVNVRGIVNSWIDSSDDDHKRIQAIAEDKILESSIVAFLNLLTELGVAVNNKIVNIPVTYQLWYPAIPYHWKRLEFYITDRREQGVEIGVNFEKVVKSMERYREKRYVRFYYWLRMGL
ncbi:MAG: hypothetical protein AAFP89_21190 [Bacteroidota bacterium]